MGGYGAAKEEDVKKAAQEEIFSGPPRSRLTAHCYGVQAVKLLPQPHPPVAFGLLKVKPDPCIEVT
jgi:hypothetical protein